MLFWSERNTSGINSAQIKEICTYLEGMEHIKEARLEDQISSLQLATNSTDEKDEDEINKKPVIQMQSYLSFFDTCGLHVDDVQFEEKKGNIII
jgi:hypothetical protein